MDYYKYEKYKQKYYKLKSLFGGKRLENNKIINIINSSVEFNGSAVGTNKFTMKNVNNELNPIYPEEIRPMYNVLQSLGITMNKEKKVDQIFLGLKEIKKGTQKQNENEISLNLNRCINFIKTRENKIIKISKDILQYILNDTCIYLHFYGNEKIAVDRILQLFHNAQLIGDYKSIYAMNALRTCVLSDIKMIEKIKEGVENNFIRKLTDIQKNLLKIEKQPDKELKQLEMIQNIIVSMIDTTNVNTLNNHISNIKNDTRSQIIKLLETLFLDNKFNKDDYYEYFTNFKNDMDDFVKYYETYKEINKYFEIRTQLIQFEIKLNKLKKISPENLNEINTTLQNINRLNRQKKTLFGKSFGELEDILIKMNKSLDMLAPHICVTQKIFPIVENYIHNNNQIFYNEVMSGIIKSNNNDITLQSNTSGKTYYPILLANVAGIDLTTDYKGKLYLDNTDVKKKYDSSINKIFENLKQVICDNEIQHFCYIPFGLGAFLSGLSPDKRSEIIQNYAECFMNNFLGLRGLNIYINMYSIPHTFLLTLINKKEIADKFINFPNDYSQYSAYLDNHPDFINVEFNNFVRLIFHKKDNFSVAVNLSTLSKYVMFVNPSDMISIIMGEYGYYWNGHGNDYIVGEEVLANQTTMAFLYPIVRNLFVQNFPKTIEYGRSICTRNKELE